MNNELPDCFCIGPECDWVFEVSAKYYRVSENGDPDGPRSAIHWSMEDIPQPLAQAIFQAGVDAVNKSGWEIYKAYLEACVGEDNPVAALVRKMPVV